MKLKITIDGKVYEVDVEVSEPDEPRPGYVPPTPASSQTGSPAAAARSAPSSAPQTVADESKVCRSPVSGVVVRVNVQPGQEIQANDLLMVLEAMKMETEITSPMSGRVAKVNAESGQAVQSGQVLVEFE